MVRVTVVDTETGDSETMDIPENNYILVCSGECHISSRQIHPTTRTEVLVIRHHEEPTKS